MRILGIDPGYATIGFGLITAERAQVNMLTYGAITTPAGLPLSRRLYQIGTDMEDLIGQLKPDVISIEELFFNTNLTTGIATAYYDSSPVVFITCNVSENLIGKDSFQEVDITGISMPITKCNYLVRDPEALADVMREAFAIARSGRPGPVLVDIAKNVTAAEADYEPLPLDQHANHGRLGAMLRRASHDLKTPEPDAGDIQTLLDLIEGARKPLVLVCLLYTSDAADD